MPKPQISRRPAFEPIVTTVISAPTAVGQLPINLKPLPPNPDLLFNDGISQNKDSWRGVKFYHVTPFGYASESETTEDSDLEASDEEILGHHNSKADL